MRYRYSRSIATENQRNIRQTIIYAGLTVALILGIVFFGIPALGKLAAFLHDIRSTNQPVDTSDTTPPAPPRFEDIPQVTNKTVLEVTGKTEAGARVTINANDKKEELLANSSGSFIYKWSLWKGENKINAKAKDEGGNESEISQTYLVTFDKEPPDLTIQNPSDGKDFSGSKERQIAINGTTEEGASVTINDRIVAVDSQGSFVFFTTLSEGDNTFNITAKDKAGNQTDKKITVKFSL